MNRVRVGLVQINNSFSNQDYLPYSVGLLQAYAQKHAADPQRYEFLPPLFRRLPVEAAVEQLAGADLIGFSAYVWNCRLSLEIARRIKERHPRTLIVFGGPHVPDRAEEFMLQHRFVDLCCHGEGEQVFLKLLESFPSTNWDAIPSVSYVTPDGKVVTHPKITRLRDLTQIPSPYLEGAFDPLMAAHPGQQWLGLWETNRGCPFSCSFCDWGSSVQAKLTQFDMPRLQQEAEWFADKHIEFIFCCDANFGILPRDLDIVKHVAEIKKRRGYPHALSVQNTKNATERAYQVQKLLSDAGLNKGVTISLQSLDPTTLTNIKRQNISLETYQELQRRFTRDRVETYSDLILGLPGETYDSFAEGASRVIEQGQHNRIQFNNLSILPNAEMGDPNYQRKHGMVVAESNIINIHGSLAESDTDVAEKQQLVVATATLPREDWVRTRAFGWWAAFLHFDKLLQIPFILIHQTAGISYRELIEAFSEGPDERFPLLRESWTFFRDEARRIQNGGEEFVRSEQWLNIWWPADEYVFIKLSAEKRLAAFYQEAELLLSDLLKRKFAELPPQLLHEALTLNHGLMKQPFQDHDLDIPLSYNIWEFYTAVLQGQPIPLEQTSGLCHIDRTSQRWLTWDDWCREVVWYGNKKGAYLYGHNTVGRELAGHY
jgi:radical SAM superfamily enzyme YgiQ (UPF0313 family)